MATGAHIGNPPSGVDIDIDDERTIITATGGDEAAVVVRSESGEQIYLPPERPDDEQNVNTYQGEEGPYEGSSPYDGDGPYGATRDEPVEVGLSKTASGFRILHEEPITDIRVLR